MSEAKKAVMNNLLKGAGFTVIGLFFSKAMGYLYRIIVGRYIGPEAYGQISIGIMILGFAKAVSGGPLNNALEKYIPEYRSNGKTESIKGIVLSSIHISFLMSIIVGVTIFFSAEFLANEFFDSPGLVNIIRIFGLLPIISSPYERFLDTTIAYNTAKYEILVKQVFQNAVKIGATIILVFLGHELMGAVWAWVLATFLSAIAAFYVLEKKIGPLILSDTSADYQHRKIIIYSYPLLLSGIIGTVQGWADTAILGYYLSDAAVGFYNAAYPTAMLILIPTQALGTLALTSLSELGSKDEGSLTDALKTMTNWIFALVFPSFLLMALFAEEVLMLLFGNEYTVAATALSILAFSNLIGASVGRLGSYLKSKGYTKIIFYNTIIIVTVNLALNIALIPKYGIVGAAIGTGISAVLGELLLLVETYRFEGITSFHRNMIKSIISGIIAISVTYLGVKSVFTATPTWALLPAGIIFGTLYLLLFFKIGGLTDYDKDIIISLGRKAKLEDETRKTLEKLT